MTGYRPIGKSDRSAYLEMAQEFYHSEAVHHPIPACYIENTFEELMRSDTYAQAYIFEYQGATAGYALLAKTFSQEAGGLTLWVEELYIKESYRGQGLGRRFLLDLTKHPPEGVKRIRLETEEENTGAFRLYRSLGFQTLDYDQMVLER